MNAFFDADGPLLSALTKLGKLVFANLLWLICCLPVLTVIPATTSFYYTVVKSIRRDRGYVAKEFFRSMKRTFGKGILFSLLTVLWMGALFYGRLFAIANGTEGFNFLLYCYDLLIAVSACVLACLIPVFSRFEMKFTALLKLSFVMAIRFLYFSVPLVLGTALIGWLILRRLPACILVLPGLWCYGVTFIMEKMLKKYMPPAKGDEDAWYRE